MPYYEYKVVPAPDKTPRVKGLKGVDRFAYTLETILCDMGAEGWDYVRAETFQDTERKGLGLAAKSTVSRNLLIFRREIFYDEDAAPQTDHEEPAPVVDDTWTTPPQQSPERRLVANPADRAAE